MLDRLIQREVSVEVEVPATTVYAYDAQEIEQGLRVDDGEWRRQSDTELDIGLNDTNGLSFPDLTLPTNGVEVSWDGAAATILNLTGMEIISNPSAIPLGIRLTFDGTLPVAGTALTLMVPSGGTQTVTQTAVRDVWAARRDYRGRDFLRISSTTGSLISIESTRFIVRAEGPAWALNDTFIDDKGQRQTVQGIGEIGRGRWLELLVKG